MMALDVVTTDIGRPLDETGGAIVDADFAPEIDQLLPQSSALATRAAEAFVRWLYPTGSTSRIPVVAVTGTNGKTTTCHMISRIMKVFGHHTGKVCTSGIYIDEQFIESGNSGAHHYLFEKPGIDFVVLEEYFGRIARAGFPFSRTDVAVCTNVTKDHLGRIGIHTLEEMTELKRAVMVRARDGVVLNADDANCLAMLPHLTARKTCLVSSKLDMQQIKPLCSTASSFCVLEQIDERSWIVIHDEGNIHPLIAVDDIPATFSGQARHNTCNAMSAAAACFLSGADVISINEGLSSFEMGFRSTPGRLNIYDDLPFQVIMDFAHNEDSFHQLCKYIDQQEVAGKKIVMMSVSGDRQDDDVIAAAAEMAGYFDHYICRNYPDKRGRPLESIPDLSKEGLLQGGVEEHAISMVTDASEAIQISLDLADKGDLLVLLVSETEIDSIWEQVTSFDAGVAKSGPAMDQEIVRTLTK